MIDFDGEIRIVIFSSSFIESRTFYEEILELEVLKDWNHGEGQSGVVYKLGKAYLEILESAGGISTNNSYTYCQVKDINSLWSKLKDKVKIKEEIADQPWGHRNFSIEDPSGYQLKFFSLL